MIRLSLMLATIAALGLEPLAGARAEGPIGGHVVVPDSSVELPDDIGQNAHTTYKFFVPYQSPETRPKVAQQTGGPPYSGYFYETPASLGCVYNLVPSPPAGCNPNSVTVAPNVNLGTKAIAIVDAYHYPTAAQDLTTFSKQFGLPLPSSTTFQVVFASGRQPRVNSSWNIEEALDIEWAHAMAPNAKIYLVEAASNSYSNLLTAVSKASLLVAAAGGGEVSMSWGGTEFSGETAGDKYFTTSGVVYFAAAGDSPGVIWPATSPYVVAAGGTSISRNPTTGYFMGETTWQSGGGGPSLYEALPSYQTKLITGFTKRATPDVSADANPSTGVWVYDSPYWYIVGGTSVATPVWAGIVNAAGNANAVYAGSSNAELTTVYSNRANPADFNDITSGSCGPNNGYVAAVGWDPCTGVGSPHGRGGK